MKNIHKKTIWNLVSHFSIVNFYGTFEHESMKKNNIPMVNKFEMTTTDHLKFTLKNVFTLFLFRYTLSLALSLSRSYSFAHTFILPHLNVIDVLDIRKGENEFSEQKFIFDVFGFFSRICLSYSLCVSASACIYWSILANWQNFDSEYF